MRARRAALAGFTLVEVMIALSILAMGLTVLLLSASGNLAATRRAEKATVVAELARGKMYDIEEELTREGFQQLAQDLEGDFDEEGWPDITWEARIVKIELPNLESLTTMAGEGGEGGEGSPLMGLLAFLPGGMGAMAGGEGLDAAAAAGAGVLTSQYELLRNILEESIRKITLTVKYKVGTEERELVLDLYLTDPSAIDRQMGGIAGGATPGAGEDGGEDPGTGRGRDSGGRTGGGRSSGPSNPGGGGLIQ